MQNILQITELVAEVEHLSVGLVQFGQLFGNILHNLGRLAKLLLQGFGGFAQLGIQHAGLLRALLVELLQALFHPDELFVHLRVCVSPALTHAGVQQTNTDEYEYGENNGDDFHMGILPYPLPRGKLGLTLSCNSVLWSLPKPKTSPKNRVQEGRKKWSSYDDWFVQFQY